MIDTLQPELISCIGKYLDSKDHKHCLQASKYFAFILYSCETYTIVIDETTINTLITKNMHHVAQVLYKRMPLIKYIILKVTMMIDIDLRNITQCFRQIIPNITFEAHIKCCKHADRIISKLPHGSIIHLSHGFFTDVLDTTLMLGKTYRYIRLSSSNISAITSKTFFDNTTHIDVLWGSDLDMTLIDPYNTHVILDSPVFDVVQYNHKDLYKAHKIILTPCTIQQVMQVLKQEPLFQERTFLQEVEIDCGDYNNVVNMLDSIVTFLPKRVMYTLTNKSRSHAILYFSSILSSLYARVRFACNSDQEYRAATLVNMILQKNYDIVKSNDFHPEPTNYDSVSDVWNHMYDIERCKWACLMHLSPRSI